MSEHQILENIISAHHASIDVSASDFFHAEWERARPTHLARYWSGEDAPPERHAEARVLWSDKALCVRFVGRQSEPLVTSHAPQTEEKTIGLWERDVCEIFIAPNIREPENYFEFEAAPTGEWIDLKIRWTPKARQTDWRYRSGMTAAGAIEKGHIIVAMRVPWEAFGQRPHAGERWHVNLFRCVGSGAHRGYLVWQPTRTPQPNFHLPQAFGWLRFDE
jgi:hypothetical protein